MTAPSNDLVEELHSLAGMPVPVSIDVDRAVHDGRVQVHRRRARAVSVTVVAGLVLGGATALAWPPSETGGRVVGDGAVGVADAAQTPEGWTWSDPVFSSGRPAPRDSDDVFGIEPFLPQGVVVGYSSGLEAPDARAWFGSVLDGQRAGYVASLVVTRSGTGCAIALAPPGASGRECRTLATELGDVFVVEFEGSEQGRVRTVVAEHGGFESVVSVSTGFPQTARNNNDVDQLPWDGRDPAGESTNERRPPLRSLPITLDQQVAAAWSFLGDRT